MMTCVEDALSIVRKIEQLAQDANSAIPAVVMASFVAFLSIIGLSWLLDGRSISSSNGEARPTTPKKSPPATGYVDTPLGRRSTRKSRKPEILDPSQPRR